MNEIDTKSLDVCAVFLDIAKAFDKVWHDGLFFKIRQNSVSRMLLKFLQSYLNDRKQRHGCSSADYSIIGSAVISYSL